MNSAAGARPAVSISTVNNDVITLYYKSGWSEVILHGSVKGGKWQDYKLSKVVQCSKKAQNVSKITLDRIMPFDTGCDITGEG